MCTSAFIKICCITCSHLFRCFSTKWHKGGTMAAAYSLCCLRLVRQFSITMAAAIIYSLASVVFLAVASSSCSSPRSNKARPKAVRLHRSRSACACRRGTASAGSLRGRVAMGSPGRRWSAINRGGREAMRGAFVASKVSRCAFIGYGRTQ